MVYAILNFFGLTTLSAYDQMCELQIDDLDEADSRVVEAKSMLRSVASTMPESPQKQLFVAEINAL